MVSFPKMIAAIFKTLILLNIIDSVLSADDAVENCIRYIKNLYDYEIDPLKIFEIGFLSINYIVIQEKNKQLAATTEFTIDDQELYRITKLMNIYAAKYFNQVLNDVKINAKASLPNSDAFCAEHFNEDVTSPTIDLEDRVAFCTGIIDKYFQKFETGAEVFDYVYKAWTEKAIDELLLFSGERDDMTYHKSIDPDITTDIEPIITLYYDSIFSYYSLFKSILNKADVRGFTTPDNFCYDEINRPKFEECSEELGESSSP